MKTILNIENDQISSAEWLKELRNEINSDVEAMRDIPVEDQIFARTNGGDEGTIGGGVLKLFSSVDKIRDQDREASLVVALNEVICVIENRAASKGYDKDTLGISAISREGYLRMMMSAITSGHFDIKSGKTALVITVFKRALHQSQTLRERMEVVLSTMGNGLRRKWERIMPHEPGMEELFA